MSDKLTRDNYDQTITDINTFDEDNIRYIKPAQFMTTVRTLGIYYNKPVGDTFNKVKLIFLTPMMIVPFDISVFENDYNTFYTMTLSFANVTSLANEDEVKQLHAFIRKVDSITESVVNDNASRWKLSKDIQFCKTLKRLSIGQPQFMNVAIPQCRKKGILTRCLNESGKISPILDTIEKQCVVRAVIELTEVVFTQTKCWLNYSVLQIRRYDSYSPTRGFFFNVSILADEEVEEPVKRIEIPVAPPPPIKKEVKKETPIYKHIPTPNELKDALSNLRKTKSKESEPKDIENEDKKESKPKKDIEDKKERKPKKDIESEPRKTRAEPTKKKKRTN